MLMTHEFLQGLPPTSLVLRLPPKNSHGYGVRTVAAAVRLPELGVSLAYEALT